MNDKFSKLILLIQANLKKKNEEREDISKKRDAVMAEMDDVSVGLRIYEGRKASLEDDLTEYKKYSIYKLISFFCIGGSILAELLLLGFLVFYNYDLWRNILNISSNFIAGTVVSTVTIGLVSAATVLLYKACKSVIETTLDCKKIRDKYKSSDEIREKLNLVKQEIQNLIDELNAQKDKEHELNVMLEDISRDIAILEEKLGITSNAFVAATLKIEDAGVEERLDAEYEESGIEEQVQALDAGEAGKRFVITKREEKEA